MKVHSSNINNNNNINNIDNDNNNNDNDNDNNNSYKNNSDNNKTHRKISGKQNGNQVVHPSEGVSREGPGLPGEGCLRWEISGEQINKNNNHTAATTPQQQQQDHVIQGGGNLSNHAVHPCVGVFSRVTTWLAEGDIRGKGDNNNDANDKNLSQALHVHIFLR